MTLSYWRTRGAGVAVLSAQRRVAAAMEKSIGCWLNEIEFRGSEERRAATSLNTRSRS